MIALKVGTLTASISRDLRNWVASGPPGVNLVTCCSGKGLFLAAGYISGVTILSEDGYSWTNVAALNALNVHVKRLKYLNGIFFAVGYRDDGLAGNNPNCVYYSLDGVVWNEVSPGGTVTTPGMVWDIAETNGVYVFASQNAIYYTADDIDKVGGPAWTKVDLTGAWPATIITASGNNFVVAGYQKRVAYSADGITWTEMILPYVGVDTAIYDIEYCAKTNSFHICTGQRVLVAEESDLTTWDEIVAVDPGHNFTNLMWVNELQKMFCFDAGGKIYATNNDLVTVYELFEDTGVLFSHEDAVVYEEKENTLYNPGMEEAYLTIAKIGTLELIKDSATTGFSGHMQTYSEQLVDGKIPVIIREMKVAINRLYKAVEKIMTLGGSVMPFVYPTLGVSMFDDLKEMDWVSQQINNMLIDGTVDVNPIGTTHKENAVAACGGDIQKSFNEVGVLSERLNELLELINGQL
jgi:hypothetical protein